MMNAAPPSQGMFNRLRIFFHKSAAIKHALCCQGWTSKVDPYRTLLSDKSYEKYTVTLC